MNHPEHERLHEFVEASLDAADTAVVESHLATCATCRVEVEELQSLFSGLSSLPYHAPPAGFAERVMAHVKVRRPWFAWVEDWLDRLAPRTTRAWALTSAMVALPAVATTTLVWWVLSRPGVTVQGLWVMATEFAGRAASVAGSWAWAQLAGSNLAGWAISLTEAGAALGRGGLGLGLVMFATLTAASIWILYRNLFRTESRRTDYATFVF